MDRSRPHHGIAPESALLDPLAFKFITNSLGSDAFEVIQLAGDASTRRYFRIVHGQQTWVLMAWDPFVDDGQYPFLSILNHFKSHDIQVPEVLAKSPTLGLIILEDLGDLTLERKFWEFQNQSLVLPFYKQAVDELIKIHYSATMDRSTSCVAFNVAFNTEKLMWEMNYGLEHMLLRFCRLPLTDHERTALTQNFLDICTQLDREPKLICHRDYHSRNIMLKHNRARIIDFQDARMGTPQYDLVSLVHDSYVDLNEQSRTDILEYYLSRAAAYRNGPLDRNHFYSVFRVQTIQRCFKACGSFASFFNMREDTRYLKYLKPTVEKVAQTLDQFQEFSAFSEIIKKYDLINFDFMNPLSGGSQQKDSGAKQNKRGN